MTVPSVVAYAITSLLAVLVTALASHTGGIIGPVVPFLALVPPLGTLLGGIRVGSIGTGLAAGGLALLAIWPFPLIPGFPSWMVDATLARLTLALGVGGLGSAVVVRGDRLTTTLEASRQLASAADLAKSQLLANCSHDLRTPLDAVLGYVELLSEEAVAEERRADLDDLHKIEAASRLLLSRVDRVLELARLEAGQVKVTARSVAIGDLVGRALRRATAVGPVDATVPRTAPLVRLDPDGFERLVVHLVNSLQVGPDTPPLVELVVSVEDDVGVRLVARRRSGEIPDISSAPPAHLQAHQSSGAWSDGALSLQLARRLAALLSGRLVASSDPSLPREARIPVR